MLEREFYRFNLIHCKLRMGSWELLDLKLVVGKQEAQLSALKKENAKGIPIFLIRACYGKVVYMFCESTVATLVRRKRAAKGFSVGGNKSFWELVSIN